MTGFTNSDIGQKKAFDATVCFSFFGTWLEAIEAYETEADTSSNAYKLFKAIAYYSMYGVEPEFENSGLDAMWKILSREIDNSVSRRKCRFGKEEVTEREQAVIDAWKALPHASVREVAMTTGIHRSSVERIKRKYWRQLEELRRTAIAAGDSECVSSNSQDGAIDCSRSNGITETRQRDTTEEMLFDEDEEAMREWMTVNPNECCVRDDELPF